MIDDPVDKFPVDRTFETEQRGDGRKQRHVTEIVMGRSLNINHMCGRIKMLVEAVEQTIVLTLFVISPLLTEHEVS